jgi:1-acyl-sn-glycerol-3-phosphate acyltransferase
MLYWLLKIVLTPIFYVVFRIRITDSRQVPESGPVILAANHQSFCDSLFIPLSVRRRVTYLAKAEYFDDPKQAWFYRGVGQIPIRRGGGDESRRALDTAAEVLAAGKIIALYPEGTRADDGQLHRGRTGVARMALETGAPVIPVGIRGTTEVQPIGSRFMRPFRPVGLRFGEPRWLRPADVDAAGDEHRALRQFTDALMAEISELSGRPYVDEYAGLRSQGSSQGRNHPET